jgi:hypothetical protein
MEEEEYYEEKEHQPAVFCNVHAMGFLLGKIFFINYKCISGFKELRRGLC